MAIVRPGLSDEERERYSGKDNQRSVTYYDQNGAPIGAGSLSGDVAPNSVKKVYRQTDGSYAPYNFATNEAASVFKAWSTPPRVSIKNGTLELTGTKDFLKSDTAKDLRKIFSDMKGQTYNTEALNKQIEAWNTDLQKMAEQNSQAVLALNEMNLSILNNYRGGLQNTNAADNLFTWDDYTRISNSAAVGKSNNAATSSNLIFIGYEWDEKGNKKPKYVQAKDFYSEFNSIPDDKKRQALSGLITQMNNGDAGAASKVAFLYGGLSEFNEEGKRISPANVELGAGQRFLDALSTGALNFTNAFLPAADFITMWTAFGVPRQLGRISAGFESMSQGGDWWSGYMKDDTIRKAMREFDDVVSWETAYKMQLTPGTTEIASTVGNITGGIAGMAYSIWGGMVAGQATRAAINRAISAANQSLLGGNFGGAHVYTADPIELRTGVTQQVTVIDNGVVLGDTTRLVNVQAAGGTPTVILPEAFVKACPNFAPKMAEKMLESQARNLMTNFLTTTDIAAAGDRGIFAISNPATGKGLVIAGADLADLTSTMNAFRIAMRGTPLVANSVFRNLDYYYMHKNRGDDVGDIGEYVLNNTVSDIIRGGIMIGGASVLKDVLSASRSAKIPAHVTMDAADISSRNSQSGFWSADWVYPDATRPQQLLLGSGNELPSSVAETFSTITTINNEKFFISTDMVSSSVPGDVPSSVIGGVGNLTKNFAQVFEVTPTDSGFALITTTTDLNTGKISTTVDSYPTYEEATRAGSKAAIPTVNPSTLMNSDLAATGNIVPFNVGGRSALKILPNGVSRARIQSDIVYLSPSEYESEVNQILVDLPADVRAAYDSALTVENIDELSQQIYAKESPLMDAPRLFVPRTKEEAVQLAQSMARARAVAAANPDSSPVMPVQSEPDDIELLKRRRMVTERTFVSTPAPKEYNEDYEFTGAAKRLQLAPAEYYNSFPEKYISQEEGEQINEKIPSEWQREWFVKGNRKYRDKIADLILSDPELRNACLVKMYDEWVDTNREMGYIVDIPYEEWLDTDITLYRWSGDKGSDGTTSKVLSYSFSPGGYPQFGRTSDSITITPRETTGMGDWFNSGGSEQEVFVPIEVIKGKEKLNTELKTRQRAAINKAGRKAPDVSDIKTYSETMTNDILNGGVADDFVVRDLYRALATNKVVVYGDLPSIKDGDTVYVSEEEAKQKTGKDDAAMKYVNLSDVAWNDARSGILASDTVYPTLFDWADANRMVDTTPEIDNHGVKVKRVQIGDHIVPLDYEIADRIAKLNELGFETYNSHSGIAADHEHAGDGGDGYIQFSGAIDDAKISAIRDAAKKAGMGVRGETNMLYGPTLTVRQSNTADGLDLETVVKMANERTAKRYKLPEKGWFDAATEKGNLGEVLDYRSKAEKRIYVAHGGYAQPDDAARKKSWDIFFSELGAKKTPDAVNDLVVKEIKKRKTITVEKRTPRDIVVTEYGLPKRWFSNKDEALDFKEEKTGRNIYEVDSAADTLDRPPVTMDNIYLPGIRGENGVSVAMDPVNFRYTPNTSDAVERFNGLMAAMPTLIDSPTDYTQGIVDIAAQVKAVYNEVGKAVDLDAIYEDYARQIAEGVEQPTVSDNVKETLKPLSDMLNQLGHYFDPSGKSLTQEFYLPTGAPSKKLATIEDALLHPEKAVDPDQVLDGSFDDILIDPLRVGDSGFWEKRTGELFRNEDGEFTMSKAGTLEENLMAYTVSALTRGQNRLLVTANNEVAMSKIDRNRNTITTEQALKGLKSADKNRARIRASQLKAARSYDKALKKEKMGKLVEDYSDKATINAIEEAYASRNFVKELDYTRRTNKDAKTLGYRQTLTINPLKGSALRFGTEGGIKGIANDIRAASHITITGTKWVRRYGEYVNVGFGMSEDQQKEYGFTQIEPAVNLGDSANMMFSPDRAAAKLFENIQSELAEYTTTGGWGLTNILNDFARQNFPLITNPERSVNKLVRQIAADFDAYNGTEAFNISVMSHLSTWVKNNAANNINSAIQMADITHLDDRTIRAINQIMTKANVGVAVYQGKIVSALQQMAYQATLAFNFSPMVGNILSEPERAIDFYGYKVFARAMKKMANPEELARVKGIVGDLPSRFADDRELVGLAEKAKSVVGRAAETYTNISMSPLQKSEEFKNLLFWLCAEENAKLMYPNDPSAQLQNTLRTFNDTAIAGGPGTTPGVANSDLGRAVFILKTFSLRNWDDFVEMVQQIGRSRSGSYKWDRTSRGQDTGGQGGYSSTAGKKFDWKKAGRFMGGTLLRRYLLWLLVLGPLGRSIWDALGGDPTGLTENFSRGLYDDEGTDAYEGMTPIDNIINAIPTGFIFGTLKDLYFAARRSGVETGNFFGGIDITKDPRLQKDLRQHLPVGTVMNRLGDMLELLDRGYSYNSYGNKTYAAPETIGDVLKGFMLGKSTTSNAQAYNKYRYGSVNIWGDLFSGDWMDFAMSANPFADDMGLVKFDTTRKNYNGVFKGSYNDVPTMQAAVANLRSRRATIIREYNEDLEKYTGAFEGLNDSQRKALAEERKEKKIQTFTDDVQRLVNEYQKAGNALSDKQITTLMYLFDFNEGDDDTYDSQKARQRYVEAGLPDYNPINQTAEQNKDTGETKEQNYFQRSLVYQNAVQGRYGIPKDAAKAVDKTLAEFKSTYKTYKERVSALNDKAYAAAKGSATRKKYQAEVEKVQEEYLNQLYSALTPVINKYGTEVLSSNEVIESLQPYMSSMIPYSSIRKYGLTFSSGNDIVWGQLSDWVKNRWGATAPTASSDQEIIDGIKQIKDLKSQGKISQAKSQARLLLERIARGTLGARNNDVIELRKLLNE